MSSLYDDAFAQRIALVELKPYSINAAAVVTFYVASEFFITSPTDSPANTMYWGVIDGDIYFTREMFTGDRVGGFSKPDWGIINLVNTQMPDSTGARMDSWLNADLYAWPGREVTISLLRKGDAYASRVQIFSGVVDDIDYEEDGISVRIKSNQHLLDKLFQENRYAGTGGDEGGPELTGKPKPVCLGYKANIEPVPVNTATWRYQVHDGAVQAIPAVRDKGRTLTLSTDYTVDLATGFIDLVAAPAGRVTCDVFGSTLTGTFSALAADLMQYVVQYYGNYSAVDAVAITALNAARPYETGLYTGAEEMNLLDVLDQLADDVMAFKGFNRAGQFDCGAFGPPALPLLSVTESDIERGSLAREPLNAVVWKVNFSYRPNGVVQTQDEIGDVVTQTDRALYSKQYQATISVEDVGIKDVYPNAVEMEYTSNMFDDSQAEDMAGLVMQYYSVPRSKYRFATRLKPLQLELNDCLLLSHPRFALAGGKNATIVKMEESYLEGKVALVVAG